MAVRLIRDSTLVDIGSNGRCRRDGSFVSELKSALEVNPITLNCGKGWKVLFSPLGCVSRSIISKHNSPIFAARQVWL